LTQENSVRKFTLGLALCSIMIASAAHAGAPKRAVTEKAKDASLSLQDEARKVAEAYLAALTGEGDATARSYLLGGVTFSAEDAHIPNWKIVRREAPRSEKAFLAPAIKHMHDLDRAGSLALAKLLEDSQTRAVLRPKDLNKLLSATRVAVGAFQKENPLFATIARVGKSVYWHAHNPFRLLVESIDQGGQYELELHVFMIEETQKTGTRTWPLRVLRLKTESHDSGWKILPASDWDPDF